MLLHVYQWMPTRASQDDRWRLPADYLLISVQTESSWAADSAADVSGQRCWDHLRLDH